MFGQPDWRRNPRSVKASTREKNKSFASCSDCSAFTHPLAKMAKR